MIYKVPVSLILFFFFSQMIIKFLFSFLPDGGMECESEKKSGNHMVSSTAWWTGRAGEPRMPCNDELAKLKSGFRTPNILITSSIILYADSNYGIANMNTYAWYSYYIFMDIQE